MSKEEIIERLEEIAKHAVHVFGEEPFFMSLDDGIAIHEAIDILKSAQPEPNFDEWCTDCKEYDHERHCCPRWNKVIREALKDAQPEIVRCKDCRWGREVCGNIECFVDANVPPEYHGYEWFCPNGERRTDGSKV